MKILNDSLNISYKIQSFLTECTHYKHFSSGKVRNMDLTSKKAMNKSIKRDILLDSVK